MNRLLNRCVPPPRCFALAAIMVLIVPVTAHSARTARAPAASRDISSPGMWHVVDVATNPAQRPPILADSRSLWCGKYNECWVDSLGCPNLAYEILYIDTGPHTDAYTLSLKMNSSTELFYDFLYLLVGTGGVVDPIGNNVSLIEEAISSGSAANLSRFASWTGSVTSTTPGATAPSGNIVGSNSGEPETITATISLGSGNRALYFLLKTDEIFSHEDGFWTLGHGVLLDSLIASDNGTIYSDALPAGGFDSFGGSVIVGTPGAPIVSSRAYTYPGEVATITPPVDQTHTEGEFISLTASASDADGFVVAMNAVGYPAGLTLSTSNGNPASATVSGTLPCGASSLSPYTITWCASAAPTGVSTSSMLTVVVDPHAPIVAAPASITRAIGSTVIVSVATSDPDGDAISSMGADLSQLPAGNDAVFNPEPGNLAGSLVWHPVSGDEGGHRVTFTASNALTGCATTVISIVPVGTGVAEDELLLPLTLEQCRPNPFNPRARIRFSLPRETRALLQVFDVQGRRVTTLLDRVVAAGPHDVSWDGRDSFGRDKATGVYLCRLEAAGAVLSRRMLLLR